MIDIKEFLRERNLIKDIMRKNKEDEISIWSISIDLKWII